MRALTFIAFLLSLFAGLIPQAQARTLFHFTSEAGDYIGGGEELTLSAADGYTLSVQPYGTNGISFNANGSSDYTVNLAAPTGSTLAVGNYPEATGTATATTPEIDFYGDGRGGDSESGQFQILELTYDTSGNVATLAANFVQHSDNAVPASFGQIRFNSSIPYQNQTGVAQLGNSGYSVFETVGSLTVTATRQGGSSGPLSVNYATADGTDLAGRDYRARKGTIFWANGDSADKTFTIPILDSGDPTQGNGNFFINLSGADTGAQTQATVTIVNDNSAVTYVHFVSQAGDYIGGGEERTFNIENHYVIMASRNYDGGVSFNWDNDNAVNFSDSESWDLEFASASGTFFGVGSYENAMRFPFQNGNSPGLNISGDGRGSNTLTGSFQVLEARFDDNGNVLAFSANFIQHSEGATAALIGQVRYHSPVKVPVPVPSPDEPKVSVSASAGLTAESGGPPGAFTISRTGATSKPLVVVYKIGGSARNGQDYVALQNTKTLQAGQASVRVLVKPVNTGATGDRELAVKLTLEPRQGSYSVAGSGTAKVQILEDN